MWPRKKLTKSSRVAPLVASSRFRVVTNAEPVRASLHQFTSLGHIAALFGSSFHNPVHRVHRRIALFFCPSCCPDPTVRRTSKYQNSHGSLRLPSTHPPRHPPCAGSCLCSCWPDRPGAQKVKETARAPESRFAESGRMQTSSLLPDCLCPSPPLTTLSSDHRRT